MAIEEKLSKNVLSFLGGRSAKPTKAQIDEHARLLAERDIEQRAAVEAVAETARQQETARLEKMAADLQSANQEHDQCNTDIATLRAKLEALQGDIQTTEKALVATNNAQLRALIRQKVTKKFQADNGIDLADPRTWEPLLVAAADKALQAQTVQ